MPPKASGSTNALKRNQACKQCRKRKLVRAAYLRHVAFAHLGRPRSRNVMLSAHCSTCVRTWTSQCAVPPPVGFAHPTEPACSYDPVDGLVLVPDNVDNNVDRIRLLESQITELKHKLDEAQMQAVQQHHRRQNHDHGFSPPAHGNGHGMSSMSPPERPPSSEMYPSPSPPQNNSTIVLPRASLNMASESMDQSMDYMGYDQPQHMGHNFKLDPFMDLLFMGWNPDLPDPAILMRLVDIFFRCDPCGPRILHRPSFMVAIQLPPTHPDFPHPALLHAICASASRWTLQEATVGPDGIRRDRFSEFHAQKTRSYIDQTMASGAQIFPVLQACIILSWYLYAEGRWVEVWIYAGFQTRVSVPLRLNYPGAYSKTGMASPAGYLAPPSTLREQELRRRTWWMSVVFDRIVSSGGWLHSIDERDIGTELPLRHIDFENEVCPLFLAVE
ncbi:hypothetical protein M422DRAFT_778839 [Sphaerobolus stellatus SS14]|uniref:Xylanolytic transcriptional activator regulatory domain-containing protein n=1 Tax=Sphaerobolus stellatus (strain SS14) TaxID=990650 RepID=A0A0C9URZ6_SPHS4|nr:hypothetical protein M422DRAFT_778839 [Sphaerobolus stellatus SS14]